MFIIAADRAGKVELFARYLKLINNCTAAKEACQGAKNSTS
jgi:hypothetical protein